MAVAQGRLAERDEELFAVREVVREVAMQRTGRVLLIVGEAGIGKTSLLGVLRHAAQSAGYRLATAAGGEFETDLAFGVVRDLFRPLVARSRAEPGFIEPGAPAASALGLSAPLAGVDPAAVLDALYWLVVDLTEEAPLLVLVDDLQWCDESSARLLLYVMRRLEDVPVLLALGRRTGGSAPVAAAAEAAPDAIVLRPAPLSRDATADVLRRKFAGLGDDVCDRVFEASGGNPFYALALADAVADLPATAARVHAGSAVRSILTRLGRLGGDAVALARAVAVLGDGASARHAGALAGFDEQVTADLADLLADHRLVTGPPFAFVHPVIHEAVLGDIAPASLLALRARAARILHEDGAPAAVIAAHLLATEPTSNDWARNALLAAGRDALAAGSFELAARMARHVLATGGGAHRLDALALRAQAACGAGAADAPELAAEAIAVIPAEMGVELAVLVSHNLAGAGRGAEAVALLDEVRATLPAGDRESELVLAAWASFAATMSGDPAQAFARLEEIGAAQLAGDTPGERAALAQLTWLTSGMTLPASVQLDRARRALPSKPDAHWWALMAYVIGETGELDEAIELYDRELDTEGSRLPERTAATVHANRALLALLRGRLVDAEADARLCARLVNRMDRGDALSAWMLAVVAHVLVMRGNLVDAEDALDAPPPHLAVDIPTAMATYHRAFVPLAVGRLDEAAQLFAATGAWCDAQQLFNPALFCWRSDLARILVRLDRRDEAHELASAELHHAQAVQAAGLVGQSLVTLGIVEGSEQGVARISEGVALLAKSQLASAYVEALIALGGELRRLRRPSQARAPLRAALDLAERGGLGLLASEAEVELRAAGARPRRRTLRGVDALTAGEQRVARLASQGLTNRAIAQALFLSPKTVERHLGQIYSKLEITGRGELAAALSTRLNGGLPPLRSRRVR